MTAENLTPSRCIESNIDILVYLPSLYYDYLRSSVEGRSGGHMIVHFILCLIFNDFCVNITGGIYLSH